MKKKLIRITTVPISLGGLLQGQSRFMNQHYDVIGISSGGPLLERVNKNEGIRVIPVEMTRKITPFKDLKSLIQLILIFRKEKPFIVHSHTPKAGTLGMLAARLTGVPHRLHTIAGLPLVEASGPKRKLLNWVEKITYSCATKVYPNSHGLRDIAIENNFAPPSKLKVLGKGSSNGIDTDHFCPDLISEQTKKALRKKLGISKTDFIFIYIGRLVRDKGVNELIEAFGNLNYSDKAVKLLLVGPFEDDLDPLLPETVDILKNSNQILYMGWQDDVRPYFAISDCMVFPSYREGFPNVVMQAGAMGLYSIVTNINGCNEIITDRVNGTIVPPKDPVALRKAMRECLQAADVLHQRKGHYRLMIKERYERTFIWNEILKEYKSLKF